MTTTTIAVPRDVPDGYALVKHEAIEYLADQWPGAYRTFYAIAVDSAAAAPTVKAEQVQCDTCHGQGEICVGQQTFGYMSMQPPEPIMEVCPECGGEEAPSLPAAGSADLTAVRCQCCATEYPHDSYDAGFIAGSGMCQVCDAAIPAVDLPSAAPAEQPYPHGIAEDLERSDWTPIEALQWYAAGKHFDVVGGRTRIIDTGAVASNALKHASLAYLELKGDAELPELRAALSASTGQEV
ncbi:zinc finger-like domain-containing protein [Pseudomonas mendocina]|nr:zinc finger-like domain-containing protein [Pseudomonas mendocina]MDV5861342.1 zinc finger-like domain-containing protein [Pseudomonas mendocina]